MCTEGFSIDFCLTDATSVLLLFCLTQTQANWHYTDGYVFQMWLMRSLRKNRNEYSLEQYTATSDADSTTSSIGHRGN
jgi:hypothetical protein